MQQQPAGECQIGNCGRRAMVRPVDGRIACEAHYRRYKRGGDWREHLPIGERPPKDAPAGIVPDGHCSAWGCAADALDMTIFCETHWRFNHDLPPIAPAVQVERGWRRRAACLGMPTDLFQSDEDSGPTIDPAAREACYTCPVRPSCLRAGLDEKGLWGGMTEPQRQVIRRSLRLRRMRAAG